VEADEGAVVCEIRQQLIAAENRPPEPADQKPREIPSPKDDLADGDDAARQAKREAKVEALKAKAREVMERARLEERRKRGRPKK